MAYSADRPKRIVIRANRETLLLVCAASALTFVIAYGVHSRPTVVADIAPSSPPLQQDWAGHLADVPSASVMLAPPAEPLTSDALTVPKAQLALPAGPAKMKPRPCDPAVPCASKVAVQPIRRPLPSSVVASTRPAAPEKDNGLLHTLNPLNHLPDVATMKRPFTYAGDTISGWVKGL